MAHHLLISILIAITFTKVSAQLIIFERALVNDLNETCIEENGYTRQSAASSAEHCINSLIRPLDHSIEEIISIVCKNNTIEDCDKKYKDIVLPCLSEDTHETINQMSEMVKQRIRAMCENDGEIYRELRKENGCGTPIEVRNNLRACELPVDAVDADPGHLKTFFNAVNCQKYNDYNECLKIVDAGCPSLERPFSKVSDAFYQASPCVNVVNQPTD